MASQAPRQGADHNTMREVNRSLVLALLKQAGPASRASIARSTTLAKPTVSAIVDELIAEGLVREIGVGATATAGGRPPILLEFNARSQLVAGVHIGSSHTTLALADGTGVELARQEWPTPQVTPVEALRELAERIRRALADLDNAPEEPGTAPAVTPAAVGVVLPGLTDFHTGVCLLAPNLGWRDVPIGEVITAELGVPVYVHNAGQAAVVAENLEGAGGQVDDLALLYTGTGLSAAVLSGGRVFHGFGGTAGELGHCRVPGATERCNCGNVGCLETVASAPALVRRVRQELAAGRSSCLSAGAELRPSDVAQAARDGDALAREAVGELARNLGLAASWLINAYNPAVLVIAGGLVRIGDLIMEPLRAAAREYALGPALRGVEIRPSRLGPDAEVRGAVLLALQHSETYYRVVFRA